MIPHILYLYNLKQELKPLVYELEQLKVIRVNCIQGDMESKTTQEILEQFIRAHFQMLICTLMMTRGIDFNDVQLVINYGFQQSMITYFQYQRISFYYPQSGQNGSAGKQGRAITIFTDENKSILRSLANEFKVQGCQVPQWLFQLPIAKMQIKKRENYRRLMMNFHFNLLSIIRIVFKLLFIKMVKEQKPKIYRTENKFDTYMTKDAFCKFISDELIGKDGLKENFQFQNYKVIFGLFMIANVIYSHYHFIPYPQDYYILIACIIFYYVSTYIYQWFEKVKEGDIFILYDDKKTKKTFGFGASQELYQRFIVLRIYSMPNKALLVERKIDSAEYLDMKGYIVQQKMRSLINELVQLVQIRQ